MVLSARMTELEALNYILAQTGEIPVNALTGIPRNAERALETLREQNKALQADPEFWRMNTKHKIELVPDGITSKIQVAANVVSIQNYYKQDDLVLRGDFLYDRKTDLDTFESNKTVNMKILLEWDELPVQHRWYFTRVAAREYQMRWISNEKKHNYNVQEEAKARALAISVEVAEKKYSMLDNPELAHYNNRYV